MMELTVAERLMLGMLLGPIAADVITLRIVRNLQEELSFSDEESEELEFDDKDADGKQTGQVKWNQDAPQTKEFDFKPAALRIIVEQLKKANASKTLTLQQLDLYDKFIPDEEEEI
jgi:hypothetical protein